MSSLFTPSEIAARLVDGQAYAETSQLHADFSWLRAHRPVSQAHVAGFDPFWVVTRHADILDVSRSNAVFSNGGGPTRLTRRDAAGSARHRMGSSQSFRTLVQMDAPDHPKYRALTQHWLSAPRVRQLEQRIRAIARERVDWMLATAGECDFVRDVSTAYPLRVIMEILGLPPEDEPFMLALTQQLIRPADQAADLGIPVASRQVEVTASDVSEYFRRLTAARRREPRDDVASVIANACIDGQPISDWDALSYYIIIVSAGHETTSAAAAGALWALCEHPAQLAQLGQRAEQIPALVEESVRWTVPILHFMRSATQDCEVGGVKIARGDWLMLAYLSGNRDEAVFDAPFEFRSDRNPNRHISYGTGAHACLGQHLARLELRILFEELLPRLAGVELAAEPQRALSTFVNGPRTLPIRFRLR